MFYWTETPFAKNLLNKFGIPTPSALSGSEWKEYHDKWDNAPIMKLYDLIDNIQEIIYIPHKLYLKLRSYIRNKYVHKLHYLSTGFVPGKYYEFEERILHGIFNEFINFIEIEKSTHNKHFLFNEGRDVKSAMEHLNWEINECENEKQAEQAKWELAAYNWWKYERPKRLSSEEASGLNSILNDMDESKYSWDKFNTIPRDIFRKMDEIEEQYYQEDTKWLIELIQRRKNLWT